MSSGIPFVTPYIDHYQELQTRLRKHQRAGTILTLLAKRGMTPHTYPRRAWFCMAYLDQFPNNEEQLFNMLHSLSRGRSALEAYRVYHPQIDAQPGEPSNEPSADLCEAIESVDAQENTTLPATTTDSLLKRFIELVTGEPFAEFTGEYALGEHSVEAGGVSIPGGTDTLHVQLDVSKKGDKVAIRCRTVVFARGVTEDEVREQLLPGIF